MQRLGCSSHVCQNDVLLSGVCDSWQRRIGIGSWVGLNLRVFLCVQRLQWMELMLRLSERNEMLLWGMARQCNMSMMVEVSCRTLILCSRLFVCLFLVKEISILCAQRTTSCQKKKQAVNCGYFWVWDYTGNFKYCCIFFYMDVY